ncbi:MAG: hypothetical protein H6Q17_2754 [Bacteroidetes bacterium]|nr:hypothetical protein [Bacteroidota bacterium]
MNQNPKNEELNSCCQGKSLMDEVYGLLDQQIAVWELPKRHYMALNKVETKTMKVGGVEMTVQFNPSRIVSSAAKVDVTSIKERKCFLCKAHLPQEQEGIPFGNGYLILVNPFPIFPRHFTIPALEHTDQLIRTRLGDMLDVARELNGCVIFYNGPKCGASAPDHMHFQAGNRGFLPLEKNWNSVYREQAEVIVDHSEIKVSRLPYYPHAALALESMDKEAMKQQFEKIYSLLTVPQDSPEPMLNLLCRFEDGLWTLWVFPRKLHRPWQYFAEGDDNLLISPASVDLGGVFITPLEKDFEKITSTDIEDILRQISMDADEFDLLCSRLKELR